MRLSIRECFRSSDASWTDYQQILACPRLAEVRSLDAKLNPLLQGPVECSAAQLDEQFNEWIGRVEEGSYLQLAVDLFEGEAPRHPRLRPLGHDLVAEDDSSALLNAGPWEDALEPFHAALNEYGLLSDEEEAQEAATLLPEAWEDDPHAFVTVWALFEVVPE